MICSLSSFKRHEVVIIMPMPKTKYAEPFVPKTITIRQDQSDFIEKKSLNLSKFVQKKIDEEMGIKEGKK